jgi:hypothetical protein
MRRFAQFVMREAELVGASNQVHPCFQHLKALSRMATLASQGSQTLTHGAIEAFKQGRIELGASDGHVEQGLCVFKCSPCQLPCHLDHPFLLGAFDDRSDAEVWPHL